MFLPKPWHYIGRSHVLHEGLANERENENIRHHQEKRNRKYAQLTQYRIYGEDEKKDQLYFFNLLLSKK